MNIFGNQQAKPEVHIFESLSKGEEAGIATRREEVKKGLAKLGIQCSVDKVPNIAVLGSGGGMRAMIALYGTLTELKKSNLLDCMSYLSGVSGSTWCMSSLYKNEDWSEKMEILENLQREKLVKGQWDFVKAKKAALEASRDENYSLTDFWAYFIVYKLLKELDESKLSQQRRSCENGKNPYPIYAAVDKHTYSENHAGSWFEFTPHNTAVPDVGGELGTTGYVDTKRLGSIFSSGKLYLEKKEKSICYLQGLWGSALASEKEIKKAIIGALLDFLKKDKESYFASHAKDVDFQNLNVLSQAYQYVLELQLCATDGASASKAEGFFDKLELLLGLYRTSQSYAIVKEMRQNWALLDEEKREDLCVKLWEALNKEFGGKYYSNHSLLSNNQCKQKKATSFTLEFDINIIYCIIFICAKTCILCLFIFLSLLISIFSGPEEKLKKLPIYRPIEVIKAPIEKVMASVPYSPLQAVKDWIRYIHKTNSCILTWTWGCTSNFLYNLSEVKLPELRRKEVISLIDAGLAINSAYPLVLHPDRNVKLILSFDFSAGDPFETIKKTVQYCKVRGIKFPRINESELMDKDNPSNCYIFRGDGLTVMHFPLFNKVNCQDKIEEYRKRFKTFKLSYSDEDIGMLLAAAKKNVADVQQKIVEEIRKIVALP
ncbi:cytosolic phospholipase A2 gamma [Anolis carolinensis]|uniref:cytosolic phospholipase A2 gamma n=1 Tax=Anolis carolinensis TaxID=28377 RepID=UPI002F2B6B3A